MSKLPCISIVIPSYNQGQFLEEAIESVFNQNYQNLELIIVDGGSTDGSVDIIKKYQKDIKWWVSEKDKGQSDAIIKGFSKASGDLIAWLNSDDVFFPDSFSRISMAYIKNPRASIYTGGVALGAHGNGGIVKCSCPPQNWTWFKKNGVFYIGQMATFFNHETYLSTSGIDMFLTQIMDRDILYKLVNANKTVCIVQGMIGFIRFHENAKSSSSFKQNPVNRNNEIAYFFKKNSISPKTFKILTLVHQILRLLTLNYLMSYCITSKYRNIKMTEIWKSHLLYGKRK